MGDSWGASGEGLASSFLFELLGVRHFGGEDRYLELLQYYIDSIPYFLHLHHLSFVRINLSQRETG